ncbi:KH domain-containing protein [Patescibacteria group bacterium]|nr:KH domain-containing protein [Patescibacteria group bacterium]
MTEQIKDIEFVDYIVKTLVSHPEDVKLDRTVDEMGVLITLDLNPEDMGQIIGRKGQTARAIRTLLKIVGAKNNARVNLKIVEPEGTERPEKPSEKPDTSDLENLNI